MKDCRTAIYRKMGDIATQVDSLEITKGRNNFPLKINIVGGGRIETKEELDNTIEFQWSRLHFLECLLNKNYDDLLSHKSILYSNLCQKCRAGEGHDCKKDFFTNSYYKLIEAII